MSCIVPSCNSSQKRSKELTFFSLPKCETMAIEWLKLCHRETYIIGWKEHTYRICERHFSFHDYKTLFPRKLLKSNVKPSNNLPISSDNVTTIPTDQPTKDQMSTNSDAVNTGDDQQCMRRADICSDSVVAESLLQDVGYFSKEISKSSQHLSTSTEYIIMLPSEQPRRHQKSIDSGAIKTKDNGKGMEQAVTSLMPLAEKDPLQLEPVNHVSCYPKEISKSSIFRRVTSTRVGLSTNGNKQRLRKFKVIKKILILNKKIEQRVCKRRKLWTRGQRTNSEGIVAKSPSHSDINIGVTPKIKEICRACLCLTSRPFYLNSYVEIRNYELATGIQWTNLPILSIELCYRCHKMIAKITTFRQCCHIAEKYFSKCSDSTEDLNGETSNLQEQDEIYEMLNAESKNNLSQTATLCLESTSRRFASTWKPCNNYGKWKCVSWSNAESVYYHKRTSDTSCKELDTEDEGHNFYEPDDTLGPITIKTEIERSDEKEATKYVKETRQKRNGESEVDKSDEEDTFYRSDDALYPIARKTEIDENNEEDATQYVEETQQKRNGKSEIDQSNEKELTKYMKKIQRGRYNKSNGKVAINYLEMQRKKTRARNEDYILASKWITKTIRTTNEVLERMAAYRCSEEFLTAEYKCVPCAKIFEIELFSIDHKIKHDESSGKFVCEMCDQRILTLNRLQNHRRNAHLRTYSCSVCNKHLSDREIALKHVLRFHKKEYLNLGMREEDQGMACEVCGKIFKNELSLKGHLRLHDDKRNFKCKYCPRVFSRTSHFKQHLLGHSGLRPHTCPKCGATFISRNSLVTHARMHERATFACVPCGRVYYSRGKYNEHMKFGAKHISREAFRYACSWCSRRFLRPRALHMHMIRTHHGRKDHICHKCGKAYVDRRTLEDHLLRHAGLTKNACPECPSTFTDLSNLKKHLRIQHNGENLEYPCNQCPAVLSQTEELRIHMRDVHPTVFKCEMCDKKCKTKPAMRMHLLRHSESKPYGCVDCGRSFLLRSFLQKHRSKQHGNVANSPCENP